jgi:enoyl-CoA hydratase
MAPSPLVTTSVHDGVGLVTLDDPARRNAMSYAMSSALAAAVATVLEGGAKAVVLQASPPVFCSGGALDDLLDPPGPLPEVYAGLHALANCPVPTVAAVGGPAIGAGVSLPLVCDVTVVSESARFDPRFLDISIHPGGGHLWYLSRRVGYQGAAAMVICGDVLSGAEAVTAGLAWRCVSDEELEPAAMGLARRAAGRSADLVARTKATLRQTAGLDDPKAAEKIELAAQEWSMSRPEYQDSLRRLRTRL